MGLFNKKRETGRNFDEKKADEIFDSLENIEEKQISKNLKKEINQTKNIAELLKQAKTSDNQTAIKIYEKILTINPENYESYQELSQIYQQNNDSESETQILKKAIKNLSGTKKENMVKRLKEINSQ